MVVVRRPLGRWCRHDRVGQSRHQILAELNINPVFPTSGGAYPRAGRTTGKKRFLVPLVGGWADFLASDPGTRSCTSIYLRAGHPNAMTQSPEAQAQLVRDITTLMKKEGVAYDIASHRDAPPGLRLRAERQ
jgi:hypothetical protein